jgi:hypothetical protein
MQCAAHAGKNRPLEPDELAFLQQLAEEESSQARDEGERRVSALERFAALQFVDTASAPAPLAARPGVAAARGRRAPAVQAVRRVPAGTSRGGAASGSVPAAVHEGSRPLERARCESIDGAADSIQGAEAQASPKVPILFMYADDSSDDGSDERGASGGSSRDGVT